MPRGIERRIRHEAQKKIRVNITWRLRSKTGFEVSYPLPSKDFGRGNDGHGYESVIVPSKKEAMSMLLAKLRCWDVARFSVKVAKRVNRGPLTEFQGTKLDREMPWCSACRSWHVTPKTKAEHDALKCFAEWKEKV